MDSALSNQERLPDTILVIRVNAFTSIIDDGYFMRNSTQTRTSPLMTANEIGAHLATFPKTRVKMLRT